MGACSSTASPNASSARVAHKDERTLGYFSERGVYQRDKIANGFERKLLGTTRKQHWVLQDFYSINGKPQTAPFTVIDERALYDWDTMPFIDGPRQFYYPDGKKQSLIPSSKAWSQASARCITSRENPFQVQSFNEQGRTFEETFFERDGKRLFTIQYNPNNAEQSSLVYYDDTGKSHFASAENREQVKALADKVQAIMMELELEVYKQSGQTPPDNESALAKAAATM